VSDFVAKFVSSGRSVVVVSLGVEEFVTLPFD